MRETNRRLDTAPVPGAEREPQTTAHGKSAKDQLEAQTAISDLNWLMSDKQGRRFVWRLLGRSGIYRTSFTGDALSTVFQEGKRTLGLELIGEITQHCPQRFSEMQKEARTK